MKITPEKLKELWDDDDVWRSAALLRRRYTEGDHEITKRKGKYADGSDKTNRVANWIGYIVRRYVGALTSIPYQITKLDDDSDNPGPELYSKLVKDNRLVRVDVENFRNALVTGVGLELHEIEDSEYKIRDEDPLDWSLLYDSMDRLVGALNFIVLEENTVHEGELLSSPLTLMTFYDDSQIITYQFDAEQQKWEQLGDETVHQFGRVPLIVWGLNKNNKSFLTDALLGQNDEYNNIDSASGDEIRNDTDALLLLPGIDGDWVKENSKTIREMRILPWDATDQSVEPKYLVRTTDTLRVESRLKRTRDHLHVMSDVPDVEQIIGATGEASGIALKLKFLPMMQTAAEMIIWTKQALQERIDLINVIQKIKSKDVIEDINLVIQFSLPVSRLEEWEKISSLNDIVSHRTQLELLSDVGDPEAELERILKEKEGTGEPGEEDEPEATQAISQQLTAERTAALIAPAMEEAILTLSDSLTDVMARSGAT